MTREQELELEIDCLRAAIRSAEEERKRARSDADSFADDAARSGLKAMCAQDKALTCLRQLSEARSEARAILAVSERHDTPGWNAVSDCARRIIKGSP